MSFPRITHVASLLLTITLTTVLLIGCVAQNKMIELDRGDIPEGYGVVFIIPGIADSSYPFPTLYVGSDLVYTLHSDSINRLYLPAGWYTFTTDRPGRVSRGDVAYRVDAGTASRFAIVQRDFDTEPDSSDTSRNQVESQVIPVTREGLNELFQRNPLPVVTIYP